MMDAQKGYELPFPPAPKVVGNDRLGGKFMRSDKPKPAPNAPTQSATETVKDQAKLELSNNPSQKKLPIEEDDEPQIAGPTATGKKARRVVRLPIVNNKNPTFVTPPEMLNKEDLVPLSWDNLLAGLGMGEAFETPA